MRLEKVEPLFHFNLFVLTLVFLFCKVLAMLENIYVTKAATWLHASQNGQMHTYRDHQREMSAV